MSSSRITRRTTAFLLTVASCLGAERFVHTGSMTESRYGHTATLLPDSRVLVTGGFYTTTNKLPNYTNIETHSIASAETYHPASGAWSGASPMTLRRDGHTATLLKNGKVLVVGGPWPEAGTVPSGETMGECELYDPIRNVWRPTGGMRKSLKHHSATLLADGRVLVTGGRQYGLLLNSEINQCQVFDPATEKWSDTSPLRNRRSEHAAILLPTGQVLVVGGVASSGPHFAVIDGVQTCELYQPVNGTWSLSSEIPTLDERLGPAPGTRGRSLPVVEQLLDGTILAIGFKASSAIPTSSIAWSPPAEMNARRRFLSSVRLADGRVLVAGGTPFGYFAHYPDYGFSNDYGHSISAEFFDSMTGRWTTTASMNTPRVFATMTLLRDGRVLVAGGSGESSTELFQPDLQVRLQLTWASGVPTLVVEGTGGASYLVEFKNDLRDSSWIPLASRTQANASEIITDLPKIAAYYRARITD